LRYGDFRVRVRAFMQIVVFVICHRCIFFICVPFILWRMRCMPSVLMQSRGVAAAFTLRIVRLTLLRTGFFQSIPIVLRLL